MHPDSWFRFFTTAEEQALGKETFLNICYLNRNSARDRGDNEDLADRMEDMSHYMKSFKYICSKNATNYQSMEMRTSKFSLIMCAITEYMFIMLICYDPDIR